MEVELRRNGTGEPSGPNLGGPTSARSEISTLDGIRVGRRGPLVVGTRRVTRCVADSGRVRRQWRDLRRGRRGVHMHVPELSDDPDRPLHVEREGKEHQQVEALIDRNQAGARHAAIDHVHHRGVGDERVDDLLLRLVRGATHRQELAPHAAEFCRGRVEVDIATEHLGLLRQVNLGRDPDEDQTLGGAVGKSSMTVSPPAKR